MRFIHFADTHIGVTTHGSVTVGGVNSRVLDFLDCLDYLCDYISNNRIDFVLFAGDAFHHNNPTPFYVSEFGERLKAMADVCPVVMIPGNHDIASTRDVSAVDVYGVLDVPNLYCSDEPIARTIKTAAGDVYVACTPFPTKRVYCDRSGTSEELLEALEDSIVGMYAEAPANLPKILIGHYTVEGGKFGAHMPPVLGKEATVRLDALIDWDYVALGHLHLFQDMTEGSELPPVVYSGSLSRIDFGEADEAKGFVVGEIDDDFQVSYEFVEVPNRRMITIYADCRGKDLPQEHLKQCIKAAKISKEDIVRVKIDVDRPTDVNISTFKNRFKDVYHFHGFSVTAHEREMKRLEDYLEEGESVQSLTHEEILEIHLIDRKVDDTEIDAIMDIFYDIQEELEDGQ